MSKGPKKYLTTDQLILAISTGSFDCLMHNLPSLDDKYVALILDHIEESLAKPETDVVDIFLYPAAILSVQLWVNDDGFGGVQYPEIFSLNARCARLLNLAHQRIYDDDEP
jgi:hypothetical protein